MSDLRFQDGGKVLFIGDNITDCVAHESVRKE